MSVIPTVWCPYCDSANELNSRRCWHCRQPIPAHAERTGVVEGEAVAALPVPAVLPVPVGAAAGLPPIAWEISPVAAASAAAPDYLAEVERRQCTYCREWIDPQASVCPYCRTDQGTIAAVQRATWMFLQLFLCFAALGTGVVILIRLWHWGMMGGLSAMLGGF